MPFFIYEAADTSGQKIRDEGEYPSVAALYTDLRGQGLTLLDYRKKLQLNLSIGQRKVRRLVLAEFFRNLSLLVQGGVPLRQAIQDLYLNPGDPALKAALKEISHKIEGGELLSEAMKAQPRVFGKILVVLVTIGEETGTLDRTLNDAARHLERTEEIISNTRRAVTYPAFIAVAMTAALAFWMLYVLPQLLTLFKSMGMTDLPLATRVLIVSVDICRTWWPLVPGIVLFVSLAGFLARKNTRIKYAWDLCWSSMPLVGRILKASQLAFLFEYLSLLSEAGIHIVRSLQIMEESINHQVLQKGVKQIETSVMEGRGLAESFTQVHMFEPFIIRMISVGEQTGTMPSQLKILADFYLARVNKLVDTMAKTLEPLLITFSGLIFMVIAVGLLGPIYDLMTQIK
ncbi:pilin secretion/fimbrial assembly system protein, PilC [Desulfolithobacter dissulfuricans]|uniref:Pilin secretion/fimbrial assembly system protein, PilC n=1 Tax=Desulfolithobacter dissulfuricans TaxID=2795293 RepID=A0A915XHB3_9BACT|nr:type II secretion system F family protein [Desulfolithobacter dissulfuricans]BCO08479.1 pilin secretion/fimbrial assembly system protein, PilC [Desulfolithobacter dissulfuricans]